MARYEQEQKAEAWQIYIAEGIRLTGANTAVFGGSYIQPKWGELLHPAPAEKRTCAEITAEIVARCGLEVIEDGPV